MADQRLRFALRWICCLLAGATPALAESPQLAIQWDEGAISSDQFESHPAFDPVTGDLYLVRSSPEFAGWRIMRVACTADGWAAPAPFAFAADAAGVDADPFFTADGARLYFISSRADPPLKTGDDLDIWLAERGADGAWSRPARMPAPINSPGQEWFPRETGDGALHFGSDREGGFGATDIYAAERIDEAWRVRNLGGEVSTAEDEYEFEPSADSSQAVLMSGGALFRFERTGDGWGARLRLDTGAEGFHVGPLLSPSGRTLLFARRTAESSGEIFRMARGEPEDWPRGCPVAAR